MRKVFSAIAFVMAFGFSSHAIADLEECMERSSKMYEECRYYGGYEPTCLADKTERDERCLRE